MRIAMVGCRGIPASYGGIEKAVEETSVRLAARGHAVTVFCRSHYCPTRAPSYEGVALRYLPSVNTKHLEAITHSAVASVAASLRRFDIVHFHGTGPSLLSPLARAAGVGVVSTVQGLDYQRAKWGSVASSVLRFGAWCSARFPHETIGVSRTLQRHFESSYGTSISYIPNGFEDLRINASRSDGPPYLLFLGRLVPEKGVHYLIEAFLAAEVNADLVIAGPSSHSDDYAQRLRDLAKPSERIRFVGGIYGTEKASLVCNALAFCQPSDLEGLPLALLDAMASGVGVVVSDIDEHRELVGDEGRRGYMFRRGNVDDLARVISEIVENPEDVGLRAALAEREIHEHYAWDRIVGDHEALYERVVSAL